MFPRWLVPILGLMLAVGPASAQLPKGPFNGKKKAIAKQRLLERFNNMSPEQRERALSRLPAERREQIKQNLEKYNELTPQQRERLQRQFENFQELPPEKRQTARKVFRQMNSLPQERRGAIRREVARVSGLPDAERKTRFSSEEFKSKYSPEEQRMVEKLSEVFRTPPE